MQLMTWNEDLAIVAQHWLNQCLFQHESDGLLRAFPPFKSVGQNLGQRSMLSTPEKNHKIAINQWFEEATLFPLSNLSPYRHLLGTGHFTAMIWAETNQVRLFYFKKGERIYKMEVHIICRLGVV